MTVSPLPPVVSGELLFDWLSHTHLFVTSAALARLNISGDKMPDSVSESSESADLLKPLPPPQWNNTIYRYVL